MNWIPAFAGMTLSLVFCGCAPSTPKPKLVLYTDTPESLTLQLTGLFEKKYGIEVEEVMEGTSWLLTRLRAETGRPIADVFMGASGTVPGVLGAREGLLASYTPAAAQDWPWQDGRLRLRDKEWKWFGFGFAALGLVYSSATLKPSELPVSWEALAGPGWKGQITLWDPSVSGTATLFLVSSLQRSINQSTGEEGGWRFLSGFYRNIKKYAEEGPPLLSVAQGLVRLGLHLDNQYLYYRRKAGPAGASLSFYLPPQSPILTNPAALVAGAPHPQEARLFLDFLLSPEAQEILATTFWTRDGKGRIHLPEEHPYHSEGSQKLLTQALDMDFDWMAANFDRTRIHWQNHVEE